MIKQSLHGAAFMAAIAVLLTGTLAFAADDVEIREAIEARFEKKNVGQEADVTVVKLDDPDPVVVGGVLTYTLVYTNNGPATAQNIVITDTLPPEVSFGGVVSEVPVIAGPVQTGQQLAENAVPGIVRIETSPPQDGPTSHRFSVSRPGTFRAPWPAG